MSKVKIKLINKCRCCGAKILKKVLFFKNVPFFDDVITKKELGTEFCHPMTIFICRKCKVLQSQHNLNLKDYYKSYDYVASASEFIRRFMQKLFKYSFQRFNIKRDDTILEIGSADGYMLSLFKKAGCKVLGFEPAKNLYRIASKNDITTVNDLFNSNSIKSIPKKLTPFKLIILLHTFDHLYKPKIFLKIIKKILEIKHGVFIFEIHDLYQIVKKTETALFGHEHACFFCYKTIQSFLYKNDFKIIDFNFIPQHSCRGSSMIIAATRLQNKDFKIKFLPEKYLIENKKLLKESTFYKLQKNTENSFKKLRQYIFIRKLKNKNISGYGAWGRGVTSLAMSGLNSSHLNFMIDKNKNLSGKFTPVSHIPIINPENILQKKIDEIIVFNYAYLDEIKIHCKKFLEKNKKITSILSVYSKK